MVIYHRFFNQLEYTVMLPQLLTTYLLTYVTAKSSSNIITDFSDHYSQFVSVKREKLEFKKMTMYKRNYSTFSEDSFRDDVSIQNFDNNLVDVNDQFKDFYNS